MFGFSKAFAIVIVISIIISLGLRATNPFIGLKIIGGYAIIKILWNIITVKKKW